MSAPQPLPAAWLASATATATRLGRDFAVRPLELWEQVQLSVWQARGVKALAAGAWLALPAVQQSRARVRTGEGDGGRAA